MKWWPSIITSVLRVHVFFFRKTPKACPLMQGGCFVSIRQSSFEGFMASLDSWSPHVIQSWLGECESPVAVNP